ncbi:MAG: PIN domain-containing protein [Calditrichia bacterium]
MIGVDTNVLVRYIVQDDIEQSKDATRFIEKRISSSNPGFINQIVMCEVVWVL